MGFSFNLKVNINPNLEGDISKYSKDVIREDFIEKVIVMAKNESPHITGHNRDSIVAKKDGDSRWNMGTIGPGLPGVKTRYGAYLELGTAKMAAQPYFAPAIRDALAAMERKYNK